MNIEIKNTMVFKYLASIFKKLGKMQKNVQWN